MSIFSRKEVWKSKMLNNFVFCVSDACLNNKTESGRITVFQKS